MSKRRTAIRGVVLLALAGLLAGALVTSSGAAGTLTKKKVKKIATNVFNQNIGNHASRVASTLTPSPTSDLIASTTITAPARGYLVMDGIADLDVGSAVNDFGSCLLQLDGAFAEGSEYGWALDTPESEREACVSHSVQVVATGSHKVDFFVSGLSATADIDDARVTALYVPYGATGTRP